MKTSDAGIALIEEFEGFEALAYQDSVGVWTIGWGHTAGVTAGDRVTEEMATDMLQSDLAWAEAAVSNSVKVPLNQDQFDALVSFTFNLGAAALANSTLLRLLNSGDYAGAAGQFGRWVYAGSTVLPGLVSRREAERALFVGTPTAPTQIITAQEAIVRFQRLRGLTVDGVVGGETQAALGIAQAMAAIGLPPK